MNKILTLACSLMILSCANSDEENKLPELIESTYEESFEVIPNPERGFMHTLTTFSEGTPLNPSTLASHKKEGLTLLLRLFYLEKFKPSPLSQTQLNLISTDLNTIREAGMKCVLRFAYTNNGDDGTDASIDIVLSHLDQLKPIIAAHTDIIAFVQSGFVGLWGEWHGSTNDLTSVVNRKAIVDKLLEVFPSPIKIQLRTPRLKKGIFGESEALTDDIGYSDQDIARVGHHNDCFMGSINDYGTYDNPTEDKAYISQEAFYVPTGGETCPPSGIPAADCITADGTMSQLKWTYLNLDWYQPLLNDWRSDGCFEDFERVMGYRLVLRSASLPISQSNLDSLDVQLVLDNVGWSPLYYQKDLSLIMLNIDSNEAVSSTIDLDLRQARPGESLTINHSVDISNLTAGVYKYYLKIADQNDLLADNPDYSIQLANTDMWVADKGYNDLNVDLLVSSDTN